VATETSRLVRAASLAELEAAGRLVVALEGSPICLISDGGDVHAIDNRCPHMGFPLHRGSLEEGILTCHWHHARFDLCTGGTFDPWADDLRCFPVEVEGDDVFVDLSPPMSFVDHQRQRLYDGLRHDIPLVLAKATVGLVDHDARCMQAFCAGLEFGALRRGGGWSRGLTTLVCLMNLSELLDATERAAALYHGVADVAADSASEPPRFPLDPLPGLVTAGPERLGRWFRQFVEVRDAEGAERALASATRAEASPEALAEMLFTAATDHRYLDRGHTLDFVNKACEALDTAGWDRAEGVLTALPPQLAHAERMEEASSWRYPVDLVALLEDAFERLPASAPSGEWGGRRELVEVVLMTEEPAEVVEALLQALRDGARAVEVASAVSFAAATRIARFPVTNEFDDWDTALHTFAFANAVEQGLRRLPCRTLLRGVFDAAISIHLDRFLNVPAVRLPVPEDGAAPDALLAELPTVLDRQQAVDEVGQLVASYLGAAGDADKLVSELVACLLREDRNFHTIQCVEAGVRQHELLRGTGEESLPLIAAARYLAAHAPTPRAQRQTFEIARRLHKGERIYEDEPSLA
jgi:nitrite reductase/ring-hydroxylating ferredoxin subunit